MACIPLSKCASEIPSTAGVPCPPVRQSSIEPHRVARYLEELAGLYHRWYDNCRVIPLGDEPIEDVHRTRLWLNDATGQVLRNGLDLLGVDAPERM